jgi:hypothetical protein
VRSVALPFGDGTVQVQLPDRAQVVKASQPNARIAPAADEAAAVRAALEQPLGMPRIGELVRPSSRVLLALLLADATKDRFRVYGDFLRNSR